MWRALLAVRFAPAVALAIGLAGTASAAPLDLTGTWYVLVHFKDSASNNPDFERWRDEAWVFKPSGSRLKWTRYPIVVFHDSSGRFERSSRQYSRVLHFWEPNAGQLEQIQSGGLEINPRGSKTKSLSGSAAAGWRSRGAGAALSANTLTYTEIWGVEDLAGLPVVSFGESLGGSRAESLEGLTEYRTREIAPDGELRGTFNRDGTQTGSFRMMRAAPLDQVSESSSQAEVRAKMAATLAAPQAADGLAEMLSAPDFSRKDLSHVYKGRVLAAGGDPRSAGAAIDVLVEAIFAERDKGTPPAEIEQKVRSGVIRP